jgi:hypothetical protein
MLRTTIVHSLKIIKKPEQFTEIMDLTLLQAFIY